MKKGIGLFVGIVLLHFLASGCAYNVAFNAPETYRYETTVPLKAGFSMDKGLKDMVYSGRAFSSGIANRWDVPVGDIVYSYAIAYLKNGFAGFGEIATVADKSAYDVVIKINDITYFMEG